MLRQSLTLGRRLSESRARVTQPLSQVKEVGIRGRRAIIGGKMKMQPPFSRSSWSWTTLSTLWTGRSARWSRKQRGRRRRGRRAALRADNPICTQTSSLARSVYPSSVRPGGEKDEEAKKTVIWYPDSGAMWNTGMPILVRRSLFNQDVSASTFSCRLMKHLK